MKSRHYIPWAPNLVISNAINPNNPCQVLALVHEALWRAAELPEGAFQLWTKLSTGSTCSAGKSEKAHLTPKYVALGPTPWQAIQIHEAMANCFLTHVDWESSLDK